MRVWFNSWRELAHPLAGGSEVIVDQLATGLTERGHEVVLRAGEPVARRPYQVVAGGGTYSQFVTAGLNRRAMNAADVVVDVINGVGHCSPLWTHTPVVALAYHLHTEQWGLHFPPPVAALGRHQERHLFPRVYRDSLVVTLSMSSRHDLIALGIPSEHVRVLPVGVPEPSVVSERAKSPLFVAIGRLTPHKRIDLLLDMWREVQPAVGGTLVIVGDGPLRPSLEERAVGEVEYAGHVDELRKSDLLSQAWLLIHPAAWEGWGLVITEAAAHATPALAFDVPGVRDAIQHDVTGIIVQDNAAFVREWIRLSLNPDERNRLGEAARENLLRSGSEDTVSAFEDVLLEAAGQLRLSGVVSTAGERSYEWSGGPPETSIVVPAYNEAARLPLLIQSLSNTVALDRDRTQVIIVDDGSTDATASVAAHELARFPLGQVIRHPRNWGKGAALRSGVTAARGRRIVFMDADLATDLSALEDLLIALETHDVAIGSRRLEGAVVRGGARHRQIMALGFNLVVRILTRVRVRDTQCGFKAYRGPAGRMLFHLSTIDGYGQDAELLDLASRLGFTVAEVPVDWTARAGSKIRLVRDPLVMIWDLLSYRLRPHRRTIRGLTITHLVGEAADVASRVRATDGVIHDRNGDLHITMPFATPGQVKRAAERIRVDLGHTVTTWDRTIPDYMANVRQQGVNDRIDEEKP
jgi:glycosyltransferase involved in cell wall biosynthesis